MLMRLLFVLAAASVSNDAAHAAVPVPPNWEAGKQYFVIDPPQPTASGDKIEVLEVFSYACPHCAEFQPIAEKIKAGLPANAQWSYMPAEFQPAWAVFARAFYTASALGILDKSHQPLLNAIHADHKIPLNTTIEDLANFYAAYGVKAADFVETSKSFAIETKLKRERMAVKAYGVEGTPTIIINGKYRVSSATAGGYDELIGAIQYLVTKESAALKAK